MGTNNGRQIGECPTWVEVVRCHAPLALCNQSWVTVMSPIGGRCVLFGVFYTRLVYVRHGSRWATGTPGHQGLPPSPTVPGSVRRASLYRPRAGLGPQKATNLRRRRCLFLTLKWSPIRAQSIKRTHCLIMHHVCHKFKAPHREMWSRAQN